MNENTEAQSVPWSSWHMTHVMSGPGQDFVPRWSQFSYIQYLSRVQLFATPWTAASQASLFITNSWSLFKLMSIKSVMPSNHLILCHRLLLPPSIFLRIRIFSNESVLHIRWPKDWHFSFSISPSNEHPGLISFRMNWLDFLAVQGTQLSDSKIQIRFLQRIGPRRNQLVADL